MVSGRKVRLRQIRDGVEQPPITSDNNYDFSYQEYRRLKNPVKVYPVSTFLHILYGERKAAELLNRKCLTHLLLCCSLYGELKLSFTSLPSSCVISGFLLRVHEVFALLRCYTGLIGSYQRFGTAYTSLSRNVSNKLPIDAA